MLVQALCGDNAFAGSAVATDGHGHLVSEYGHPKAVSIQRALALARHRHGENCRILAASDVTGYGAIAVALHPNGHGSIIGVSLGNRSATQADTLAIQHCLNAGGLRPVVKWGFRG